MDDFVTCPTCHLIFPYDAENGKADCPECSYEVVELLRLMKVNAVIA